MSTRKAKPELSSTDVPKEKVTLKEGVALVITNPDGSVSGYYTNITPKLQPKAVSALQDMEISVSASESEDETLLHELLIRLRKKSQNLKKRHT